MARTPVVVQPPPKETRTPVVVRQGPPPKDKRAITDLVFGVIGLLLLVFAVALFGILPEEEVPPTQWQVTYADSLTEIEEVQSHDFLEEQSHRFLVPVDADTVHSIQFTVEFTDDVASSLPDTFAFQIIDPNGEDLTEELRFSSPEPATDGGLVPTYTAQNLRQVISAELAAPPTSGPQTASSPDEDLPNAQARIQDELTTRPAGDWALEVRLVSAGDCPAPDGDLPRALTCETETSNNGDPGNSLQLVKVSFTTYDAVVDA